MYSGKSLITILTPTQVELKVFINGGTKVYKYAGEKTKSIFPFLLDFLSSLFSTLTCTSVPPEI